MIAGGVCRKWSFYECGRRRVRYVLPGSEAFWGLLAVRNLGAAGTGKGEETCKTGFQEGGLNHQWQLNWKKQSASGLYTSASELVKYCLRNRTLKELIEMLWCAELQSDERLKVRKAIRGITQLISASTSTAIIAYAEENSINVALKVKDAWVLYEKCSGEKLNEVLSNCLFLFHAVYGIRHIPYLFSSDEVDELERICTTATRLLDQRGLDGLKKKLPRAVMEMYGQKTLPGEETDSVFAHWTFLFSISGVLIAQETDVNENTTKFTEAMEKLVSKIKAHDFDITEMRRLVDFNLTEKVDFAVFKKACYLLPTVQAMVDLRVVGEFLKVLKCIAYGCSDWDTVMTYFYENFREVNGELKTFKHFYQCAWLLMISPTDTLISLFLQCLENMLIVPNLIRILRKVPQYCSIQLETTFEEDSSTKRKAPILMFALRHILTTERSSMHCDAKRRNFIYMCVALSRERHALLKDEKNEPEKEENDSAEASTALLGVVLDFALVDGSLILNHLVLPALKEVFYQEIAVEIGKKLLAPVGARRTPIIWKTEEGIRLCPAEQGDLVVSSSGVSIRQLISTLLDVINENEDFDYTLISSCQDCLRLLGERLKGESSWTYKYALASWFYKCLVSYTREIPRLLYEALKDEKKQTMKVVESITDNDVSGRSLLRKLFELAIINSDLTLEIVRDGFSTSISIDGCDISGALVDVIRDHNKFPSSKMGNLVEIIKAIVNHLDPPRQTIFLLTDISESSFYGLRLIEPLLLIQEATICAIHYDKKSTDDMTAVPFGVLEIENEVAVKLLKLFCELVKDHMEKEMIDLRRSCLKYKVEIKEPRVIPNDVNISREVRVGTELIHLYIAAVILTNHVIELPPYLKILLIQLTNYHIELGRMKLGTSFDEIISMALVGQGAKEKTVNNILPSCEYQCVTSDSDQRMSSVDDTSLFSSTADLKSAGVNTVRESSNHRLLETSGQNTIFLAGTRLIKDPSVSAIIENRLHNSKKNNERKLVAMPKAKYGALPHLSTTNDNARESGRLHFEGDNVNNRYNSDGSGGRINSSRRKNKKRK
uniref:Edg1 TPR repeats region domain-containing protein n=1 Tax=Setaria digitata TaxID=48799 RepID=A0A915PYM5_9BILA